MPAPSASPDSVPCSSILCQLSSASIASARAAQRAHPYTSRPGSEKSASSGGSADSLTAGWLKSNGPLSAHSSGAVRASRHAPSAASPGSVTAAHQPWPCACLSLSDCPPLSRAQNPFWTRID